MLNPEEMNELIDRARRAAKLCGRYCFDTESDAQPWHEYRVDDLRVVLHEPGAVTRSAGIDGVLEVFIDNETVVRVFLPNVRRVWRNADYGVRALHVLRQAMVLDDMANA